MYDVTNTPSEDSIWQLAGCEGKERFESSRAAKTAQKRIEKRRRSPSYKGSHVPVEAYRCQRCGCWHLGRSKPR